MSLSWLAAGIAEAPNAPTAKTALKVEATKRTRLLNSLQDIPHPTAVPTFAEFADEFLNWAKTNLADSHRCAASG